MVTFKTCNCAARSSQIWRITMPSYFLPDKSPSNPPCLRVVSQLFHKKICDFFHCTLPHRFRHGFSSEALNLSPGQVGSWHPRPNGFHSPWCLLVMAEVGRCVFWGEMWEKWFSGDNNGTIMRYIYIYIFIYIYYIYINYIYINYIYITNNKDCWMGDPIKNCYVKSSTAIMISCHVISQRD
jgi:hypothetical protein